MKQTHDMLLFCHITFGHPTQTEHHMYYDAGARAVEWVVELLAGDITHRLDSHQLNRGVKILL